MIKKPTTDLHDMDGLYFEMTEEIASKLRDDAVAAAIDAQIKKEKWRRASLMIAEKKLRQKLGDWINKEGTLEFSDGDEIVKLSMIKAPSFMQTEPQVVYFGKLKSGKFSKSDSTINVSYVLSFFRST